MVNNWKEDEGSGAFGLLDDDFAFTPQKKVSKRDPKTRYQRPQEEWTPADVASEFSSRAYSKIRGVPGLINTKALWGALAANRKKFGVSAVIELEVLERFFGDERNIVALRKNPKSAHGMFLNAITHHINDVVQDLDMEDAFSEPEVVSSTEFVYASDGTEFDNSMAGRIERNEYEAKIK